MNTLTHKGPHPGILAIIFMALFAAGLSFVSGSAGFPTPFDSAEMIAEYFRTQSGNVLMAAFFQFGSAVPLGLLTAALVSRLQFLGNKATGTLIALFGGFTAAIVTMIGSGLMWVLSYGDVASDPTIARLLYFVCFSMGGFGYSVPLGLLIAGVSVTSAFTKALPKWLWVSGIVIAVIGQLSWFSMLQPMMMALIPLTRFPGFIWLIIAGFKLPKTKEV